MVGTVRVIIIIVLRVANNFERGFIRLLWGQRFSWTNASNLRLVRNFINWHILGGGMASTISVETHGAIDGFIAPIDINARVYRSAHSEKSTEKTITRA